MDQQKSKVTLYMRPDLHKRLKMRSVQEGMKMSELAEALLERSMLELAVNATFVCPNCQSEVTVSNNLLAISSEKLPVGSSAQ